MDLQRGHLDQLRALPGALLRIARVESERRLRVQDETLTIEEEQEATQATDDAKAADAKPEAADETGAADADHRGRAQRAQQDPSEKKEELATEDSKANEVHYRTLARLDARAPAQ